MSNPYRDIKVQKLEEFLEWLDQQHLEHPSSEVTKLIKRVEQQLAFLKYETNLG